MYNLLPFFLEDNCFTMWWWSLQYINTNLSFLPGKSHGWRSLVGCSPWGRSESDTTEQLHFHFSLSCIGEGNGNPLQCSSLENPRDGGAWWAAISGVAQSWTWLKRLSSSSIYIYIYIYIFPYSYIWMKTVTCYISKQRILWLQAISHCIHPDHAPWGDSGWKTTEYWP